MWRGRRSWRLEGCLSAAVVELAPGVIAAVVGSALAAARACSSTEAGAQAASKVAPGPALLEFVQDNVRRRRRVG